MDIRLVVIVICVCLVSLVAAEGPSVAMSLELGALAEAKNIYFSYIQNILKSVPVPDIEYEKGKLANNTFQLQATNPEIKVSADPASNAVLLEVTNL